MYVAVIAKKCNLDLQIRLAVEFILQISVSSVGASPVVITVVCRFCEFLKGRISSRKKA